MTTWVRPEYDAPAPGAPPLPIIPLTHAALLTGFALLASVSPSAQNRGHVIGDGSLGKGPAGVVPSGPESGGGTASYLITPDQGKQVGGNRFHSFGQFSIGTGETATFTGPDSIADVIARVTGGAPSAILGRLRSTIRGAARYLLNPAGLLVGSGALLDLGSSSHASTADRLAFDDGQWFDATKGVPCRRSPVQHRRVGLASRRPMRNRALSLRRHMG